MAPLLIPFVLDVYDAADNPVDRGSAILQPITPLTDTANHRAIYAPLTVALSDPPAQEMLRACDDPAISPAGWTWTISFVNVPGNPPPFSFSLKAGYTAFTCPAANPAVFTLTSGSAPAVGTPVQLAGSSLPGGFETGTTYYVVTSSGGTFELAATAGGAALSAGTSGSGTVGSEATQYLSSQQAAVTGGGGGISPPVGDIGGTVSAPTVVGTHLSSPLPLTQGGTGQATATAALSALGGAAVAGDLGGTSASPQVTGTHLASPLPVNQGGTGSATQNFVDLTANQSVGGTKTFTGEVVVPSPANSGDAVTKAYADAIAQGLNVKLSVQEATAAALPANTYSNGSSGVGATLTATANGALTVDGITVSTGDRVLVQNEATAANNGIYVTTATGSGSAPYVLARATDLNTAAQVPGAFVFVEQGTVNAGAGFTVASKGPFTIGSTAIPWTQFSGAGEVQAGTGLNKAGNTISLSTPVSIANGGTGTGTEAPQNDVFAGPASGGAGAPSFRALVPSDLAPVGSPAPSRYAGLLYGAVWGYPWKFWPDRRGATGDGRAIEDFTVTSGSLNTPSSASANFVSADVGKTIFPWTGSTWAPVTITNVNSPTSVTVTPALPGAFANTGAIIASDAVPGFNQTVTDAFAYMQAGSQEAEIYIPPLLYGMLTQASHTYAGNAQVPMPLITPGSALSCSLVIGSDGVAAGPRHWLQTSRDLPGAVLCCMRTDGTLDSTYGPACIIGGPVNTYGGGSQNFNNLRVTIRNLTMAAAYPSTYSGLVFRGTGQATVDGFSFIPLGATPSGGPWPQYNPGGPSTDQWTVGVWMPDVGNNAVADMRDITVYGLEVAVAGSEHLDFHRFRSVFNGFGIIMTNAAGGGNIAHGESGRNFVCEETSTPVAALTGASPYASVSPIGMTFQKMDLETYSAPVVLDTDGLLSGYGWFNDAVSGGGHYYPSTLVSPGSPFRLLNYNLPSGLLASQPAVPASGTAFPNYYYGNGWVNVQHGTATITAIAIDGVTLTGLTSGPVRVPSGHSITLTYSGGTPVWQWEFD